MSVETQNAVIGLLLLTVLMSATIPATAFLCRYRTSRKKRVSCGTLFAGASVVPLVVAVVVTCTEPDIWWSHEHKGSPHDFFITLVFLMLLCVLPALCVVVYYQRKKKRDEICEH
jgi:DMSO reductase anchor subunit